MLLRFVRVLRLAGRLVAGEVRRGPRAFIDMVRVGLKAFRRGSALDGSEASAVVVSVEQAASNHRSSRDPGDRAGKMARLRARMVTLFGLGLLRQGHVTDAAWVLQRAAERHPSNPRLVAAADVVAGERRVLSGSWTPPPAVARSITPASGKVLHVVGKTLPYTLAGYTVRTQSVADAQRAAGLDPEVVSRIGFPWFVGASPSGPLEEVDGIVHHRIGGAVVPPRWDDRLDANIAALEPVVESVRPAVLHAHSDFENALLALALRDRFDIPVVYEVRGFWEETWLSGSPERRPGADRFAWRHAREVACASAADRVVTLADTMLRRLVADGVAREKITIVPNAVDPEKFPPTARDRRLAADLGIREDDVVVGYISSLVDYEGVDTLLRASAALVDSGAPVHTLIVGDGSARPRLERLARTLRLGHRATFTGRVPHERVLDYYGLIDVFVVPRRDDRVCRLVTPLKPFEAMSTATALVMSGVEALRDIAETSGAAATFRPEDPDDLVATLRPLIADPEERRRLGARGREWVAAERTWARNAERYLDVYRSLGVG